jgi:hypothetical protein
MSPCVPSIDAAKRKVMRGAGWRSRMLRLGRIRPPARSAAGHATAGRERFDPGRQRRLARDAAASWWTAPRSSAAAGGPLPTYPGGADNDAGAGRAANRCPAELSAARPNQSPPILNRLSSRHLCGAPTPLEAKTSARTYICLATGGVFRRTTVRIGRPALHLNRR